MTPHPTLFRWDGDTMVPRYPKLADSRFTIGQDYLLADTEDRSDISHKHEFAWLREAWRSLPESLAEQYPTVEYLRKRALIQGGFYDETIIDAGSNAAAIRVAAAVRAMDDFALVFVRGVFAIRRVAKSQSRRAMPKGEFQASKTAIMGIVADLLGVSVETLSHVTEAA